MTNPGEKKPMTPVQQAAYDNTIGKMMEGDEKDLVSAVWEDLIADGKLETTFSDEMKSKYEAENEIGEAHRTVWQLRLPTDVLLYVDKKVFSAGEVVESGDYKVQFSPLDGSVKVMDSKGNVNTYKNIYSEYRSFFCVDKKLA